MITHHAFQFVVFIVDELGGFISIDPRMNHGHAVPSLVQ
jgi:hypothetical protein